jgi:hypothetical protein
MWPAGVIYLLSTCWLLKKIKEISILIKEISKVFLGLEFIINNPKPILKNNFIITDN